VQGRGGGAGGGPGADDTAHAGRSDRSGECGNAERWVWECSRCADRTELREDCRTLSLALQTADTCLWTRSHEAVVSRVDVVRTVCGLWCSRVRHSETPVARRHTHARVSKG
jgi:hypothetical protein